MQALKLIRKDDHGLYVKAGGYIARPVDVPWMSGYRHIKGMIGDPSKTKHKEGDKVKARHMNSTPLTRVGDEIWPHHGVYMNGVGGERPSHECWEGKCQ